MTNAVTAADVAQSASYGNVRDQVGLYRHHSSEARRLSRRLATEQVYNRTTSDALRRRNELQDAIKRSLLAQGHRELVGLLVEERSLKKRLYTAQQNRCDLRTRLRGISLRIDRLARTL